MSEIIIIKDTREPEVGSWDAYFTAPSVRGTLKTGDFSLLDYDNKIAIERKELNDLIGCLTTNRDRFERELTRAQSLDYFAVIVEGTYRQLAEGAYRSRMNPKSAWESVAAFEVRYKCPFYFMGSAEMAARKAESLLLKFHREQEKKLEEFPF